VANTLAYNDALLIMWAKIVKSLIVQASCVNSINIFMVTYAREK